MKLLLRSILPIVTCFASLASAQSERALQVEREGQTIPDQKNGYYQNPIFPGNYGDPSIVLVGEDYYAAFSRGNGIMVWRSRDLVNWEPIIRHRLPEGFNRVWAIDIQHFDGKFHVYMPIGEYPGKTGTTFANFVISAENPEGPWSEPINLDIVPADHYYNGIDPGFIQTPEGEKFLYVHHGWAVRLNDDGTKAVTEPELVYEGWDYPEEWPVECHCLESPKLFLKDDYYYMVSAMGGTSGPSTAHMSVVARAPHPLGPWENSPYNPLHHTYSHDEPFWHQGHGTVFEDKNGDWWTIYHARLNSYTEMGRPTLLMPVEWTEDGWPVQKSVYVSNSLIPIPEGENVGHGLPLSDSFESTEIGMQWSFGSAKSDLIKPGGGKLILTASGEDFNSATQIHADAPNKSFEISVKLNGATEDTPSGIRLGSNGIAFDGTKLFYTEGPGWRTRRPVFTFDYTDSIWLKMRNLRKDITFYYSPDGTSWIKFPHGARQHSSYRYTLFARGSGEVSFQHFEYKGLE